MISVFIRFYGNDTWQNAHYPTSDKIIPVRQFVTLFAAIPHIQAFERISSTHSHFLALAMVNSSDKTAITKLNDTEFGTAYGAHT